MNKDLSKELQDAFTNVVPVLIHRVYTYNIDTNWLAGFVSGEGCFSIHVGESASNKGGIHAWSRFQITQHKRDEELMIRIHEYLNCGRYYPQSTS